MASAQFLSGAPAALAVSGVGVATAPVSTITADPQNGIRVSPPVAGQSCVFSQSATLSQAVVGIGAQNDVFRYASSVGGDPAGTGGVLPGKLQMFSYKNGSFEAKLLESGVPGTTTESILSLNRGALDATRFGYTPGLGVGANAQINCPSINAGSVVRLRLAGTTQAAGFTAAPANAPIPVPAVAVNAAVLPLGFVITGLAVHAGMIYDYEVIG
jgi:hypothetical protein